MYRKEIVRFLKFCVVGTVGFVVDTGILNSLIFLGGWIPVMAKAVSFTAAVINNFLWNRHWTYPESRSKPIWQQISQFFMVNTAGLGINLAVFGTVSGFLIPRLGMKWGVNVSQVIAVGIALFWNFLANRLWTYNDVP
ncbi:GtrA family protein [Thermoflexus sp.]|uniref:GtrA family protein n=1 Tax=Thermoflexus sp. TaxID=1969742 RepID=UPI002ADE7A33|nr:GtrA family protein [Thermoflexus sp.]